MNRKIRIMELIRVCKMIFILVLNFVMALAFPTNYATMVTDTGWQTINKDKYYIKNCEIVTGLQEIEGDTYFFSEEGKMLTGLQMTPDERFFGADGKEQDGIQEKNGNLILYTKEGRAKKGWHELNDKKYYVTEQRFLAKGLVKIESNTYFFNNKGEMTTGWQDTPERRYFNREGIMLRGSHTLDGKQYYFGDDGTLYTGFIANQYFNEDGTVFIGTKTIGNMTFKTDNEGFIIHKSTTTGEEVVATARSAKPGETFIQDVYSKFGATYDKDGKLKSAGDYTAEGIAGDTVIYKDKDGYKIEAGIYTGGDTMIEAETGKEVPVDNESSRFVGYFRHDFLKKDLTQYNKY